MTQSKNNQVFKLRPGFDPWVGKIPWGKERLPTPVFWPGESHGQSMGSQRVGHDRTTFTSLHLNWVSSPPGSRWFSKRYGNWYGDHQNPCVFSPKNGLAKSRSTSLSKFPFPHYTKERHACLSLSQIQPQCTAPRCKSLWSGQKNSSKQW